MQQITTTYPDLEQVKIKEINDFYKSYFYIRKNKLPYRKMNTPIKMVSGNSKLYTRD